MELSAYNNLKWPVLIGKLRMRIMIDANSTFRSTAPQTPVTQDKIWTALSFCLLLGEFMAAVGRAPSVYPILPVDKTVQTVYWLKTTIKNRHYWRFNLFPA